MEEEDFPNFSSEFNFPSIQETAEKTTTSMLLSFVARRGSLISYFIKEM